MGCKITIFLRKSVSQVLLVFLAMLLITSSIWGFPQNLAYRHLFLDSMLIICLMSKPFMKGRQGLSELCGFLVGHSGCLDFMLCAQGYQCVPDASW